MEKDEFFLDNGLEVVIVKNEKFKESSIRLVVDAGNIYSPLDMPGLAHLLEHILTHNSTKYPEINYLSNFIQTYSGFFNASTTSETVQFFFQIADDEFEKAADILAWAISSPLWKKENIQAEIKVVDEEFRQYMKNTFRMRNAIISMAIDESFPESFFSIGNKETLLKPDIENKLKEFYTKYFTANRMKLIICSKKSRKDLKNISNLFRILPKQKQKELSLTSHPVDIKYKENFAGTMVRYNSGQSKPSLSIVIILPSLMHLVKYGLNEYLQIIVTCYCKLFLEGMFSDSIQEVKSSIYSMLRTTEIVFDFKLYPSGTKKVTEILEKLHSLINNLQPERKIFEIIYEMRCSNRYDPVNDFDACEFYSIPENYRFNPEEMEYNEKALQNLIESIGNIKNWLVLISTTDTNLPNTEKYFSVKYDNPVPINITKKAR